MEMKMEKRIVNGVEYVIPPGTGHIWTPPDQTVVTPPRDDVSIADAIHGLRVQGLVRGQNNDSVITLSDKLGQIWQSYLDNNITKEQLLNQVIDFRNKDLTDLNESQVDNITVQSFETVILKLISEINA
jgi:hypothetical protein